MVVSIENGLVFPDRLCYDTTKARLMPINSEISPERYEETLKRLQLLWASLTVQEYVLGEPEKSLDQQIQILQQEIENLRLLKHLEETPLGQFLISYFRTQHRGGQNVSVTPETPESVPHTLTDVIRQILPSFVNINFTVHDLREPVIAEGYDISNRRKDVSDALGHALRPLLDEGLIERVKESRGNIPAEYRVVEKKLPLSTKNQLLRNMEDLL